MNVIHSSLDEKAINEGLNPICSACSNLEAHDIVFRVGVATPDFVEAARYDMGQLLEKRLPESCPLKSPVSRGLSRSEVLDAFYAAFNAPDRW